VAVAEYVDYTIYANPLGSLNPIPIVNYVYNNPQTLPNFQADIDETVDFIEYFSEIFGLYPFHEEKYGHCMAPLSGGMEHQTMTTQGYFEKTLTAHELGHQWWGNNVTCSSWADIWVNEGFASYSEYLMLAQLYPGEEVTDMLQRHSNIKSQGGGSVWVEDSLNDGRIFSSRLTYDKGAAIVHTFRYILNNDEQFFSALRTFQNDFALSNASALDVKNALETTSGLDLTEAFEQWYFGEGFPTYSAKWNVVNNELYVQVSHAASAAGITPLFTNPLDLKFQRTGLSDTTIRFDIQSNTQLFILEDLGNVSNLSAIDPKNWIINNNGLIQHDLNLGISSVENLVEYKNEIIVSPNPSADFIEIKSLENKEFSLKIIDQKGAVCFLGKVKANHKIDVSKLKSGSYMMQIEDIDGSKITRKIVRK
jgi:aminopeptidase N